MRLDVTDFTPEMWSGGPEDPPQFAAFSATLPLAGYAATEGVALDLKGSIDVDDPDATVLTVTLSVDYGVLHLEEGTSGTSVADNDTATVTITGTAAQIRALLDTDATSVVTYATDTDTPPDTATLTVSVDDGIAPAVTTTGIAITAVNDAPVLDLDFSDTTATGNDAAAAWTQGDAPILLAYYTALYDDDPDNRYPGATLTISFTANGTSDDQLGIRSTGDGLGQIRVDGTDIYYEGTLVGSFAGGEDGTNLVITFNADACACAIQLIGDNITFDNDASAPDTSTRTIAFTFVDGSAGDDTAIANVTVTLTAVPGAPEVDVPDTTAVEGVASDLKGLITLADSDDAGGTITVTLLVDYGVLAIDPGTSGVTVDDTDPQAIVLTGTLAQIQALLDTDPTSSATFTTEDDYPPSIATLIVEFDDGTNTSTDVATIAITPVNDPAELDLDFFSSGNDAIAMYEQGDPPTYLAYDAVFDDDNQDWDGATLTIAISGATGDDQLSIEDVGTGLGELGLDGSNVTYEGEIVGTWSGGANGSPLVITFNADACACAVEAVAYSILYENSGTVVPGIRDVTFTFVDGDGTANGGNDTAVATVQLTTGPEAPAIDAGGDAAGNEGEPIALTGIVVTDDGDPANDLVTVHLEAGHGSLTIRTDVAGGIDSSHITGGANGGYGITITATLDQINATLAATDGLLYQGDPDFYGDDALSITAADGTASSLVELSSLGAQPFGLRPNAIAMTDIDGDGLDDLIVGLQGDGSDPGVIVTLAIGFGGAPLTTNSPHAFAFGDFDGDSAIDIGFSAYAPDGSGYVGYISSITGDIVEVAPVPYALGLTAADVNGDGLSDLIATDADNGRIAVMLQTTPGSFAAPAYSALAASIAYAVATGDFNHDGVLDLAVSRFDDFSTPSTGSVGVLIGNGDGTFQAEATAWAGPSVAGGIVVGDFNGDGYDDFAFASTDNSGGDPDAVNGVQVVLNNGDDTFAAAVGYATSTDGQPGQVVAGDLNGDGILDLVVTNFDTPGSFSILTGNGDGSFAAPVEFDTDNGSFGIAIGDPDQDGDLDLIIANADAETLEAFNNDSFNRSATEVKLISVNALPDAIADSGSSVTETGTVVIDVVANDTDPDGGPPILPSVAMIDGVAATVGVAVTLASGATATLNADGTISYNPHGKFGSLISATKAAWTHAVNTSATDSFTYTLATGGTATVTVTVTGQDSADDVYAGGGANDNLAGYPGNDVFMAQHGGDDRVSGGTGDDTIYFGSAYTSADMAKGGLGNDILVLQGDYSMTLVAGSIAAVEILVLASATLTSFGAPGTGAHQYNLVSQDGVVAAGTQFTVQGNKLQSGEMLTFDGSAETDGTFRMIGGAASDVLTGGALNDTFSGGLGADMLRGNGGADHFRYYSTDDSTSLASDTILDFTSGDRIDLNFIDARVGTLANDAFTFIGTSDFSNVAGQLRVELSGGVWTVEGDTNGDGNADLSLTVQTTGGHALGLGDFIL